jgi:hypothetical protein
MKAPSSQGATAMILIQVSFETLVNMEDSNKACIQ